MKYDYVCRPRMFSQFQIVDIRNIINSNINYDGTDVPAEGIVKTSKVISSKYGSARNLLEPLRQFVLHINNINFGFDLFDITDDDSLIYNTYSSENKGEYSWHKDSTNNEIFDHKLTVLVNLSTEEYTGGEFQLFLNNGEEPIYEFSKPGSVLIFPSWTIHRVTPVTTGTRNTLTQFFSGPLVR